MTFIPASNNDDDDFLDDIQDLDAYRPTTPCTCEEYTPRKYCELCIPDVVPQI